MDYHDMINIPKQIEKDGPVVLTCSDEGGLIERTPVHVAILFKSRATAENYKKKIILGKNAKTSIYPVITLYHS